MGDLFATLSPDGYPLFLANLPNERDKGDVYHTYVRDEHGLQRFIHSYDKPGRALYFTVARLKDGAWREKKNVQAVSWIWAEVDFKDHPTISPDEIRRRIEASPYPPTMIVASGHGFHCYWKLNEPADAAPGKAQQDVEDTLRLACAYIGGDTNAAEAARLLRLPGSHNTKEGGNLPVSIVTNNGRSYEMGDLVDFWLEARPIMPEPTKSNGHDRHAEGGSRSTSNEGPINVEARLRDMRFKGKGPNSIHQTQLQCTGALLRQGVPLIDDVAQVLEATRKTVADDQRCAAWDWAAEERAVEKMCTDLINKDHSLAPCLPNALWEKFHGVLEAGDTPKVLRNAAGLYVRRIAVDAGDKAEPETEPEPKTEAEGEQKPKDDLAIPLTVNEWLGRDLPLPDRLLGDWFTTTSRILMSADTGLGKTNLGMAIGSYAAAAVAFLHWKAHRPARILFMDGEMSRRLLKSRAEDVVRRLGFVPEGLFLFSREDVENFPPLNTPAGRIFLDRLLRTLGGIDGVIFDNCMALLDGDQKDEDSWTRVLPLVNDLTKRSIGQLWINHTGHDATRSYGSKTKEWRMDTTIHLTKVDRSDVDLSFRLEFRKARERTPENRKDFEDVTIALVNDQWTGSETVKHFKPKEGSVEAKVLEVLRDLLAGNGVEVRGHRMVKSDTWREGCVRCGLLDGSKPISARTIFNRFKAKLVAGNIIICEGDLVGERK